MSEFVQVITTTASRQDADRIAAELIERRLAGCVQVSGPIVSTYRWEGKTETAEEWVCTIKTARSKLAGIKTAMDELHPYNVPELIATPIVDGSEKYLRWLREQVDG